MTEIFVPIKPSRRENTEEEVQHPLSKMALDKIIEYQKSKLL